jgi:hypothetical protein
VKDEDEDLVRLPSAWTLSHRRNRAELQLEGLWQAHSNPYIAALGQGLPWTEHVKKGGWPMENWVVEGLFMGGHIGLLVGDAGTGKSLAALDLMISTVSGKKWLNHFECFTSPVVYIAGEGKIDENTAHIIGLLKGRNEDIPAFVNRFGHRIQLHAPNNSGLVVDAPLSSPDWWRNIQALVSTTLPAAARPRLWIFDPLLALINSADKADDVRPFVARCRWLSEQTNGYVLLVHHTKKGQGNQLSRSEKIRGESMWRNLCDDVLYMEQDTEDSKLVHVYANKLKRGATDDTKPMFHLNRTFDPVPDQEFFELIKNLGVDRTFEESPKSLHEIRLRHIPYSSDLCHSERTQEQTPPQVEPRAYQPPQAQPVQSASIDTSGWDETHHHVWAALQASPTPLTAYAIQQVLISTGDMSSDPKIRTRLDGLLNQGVISSTEVIGARGTPSTAYQCVR